MRTLRRPQLIYPPAELTTNPLATLLRELPGRDVFRSASEFPGQTLMDTIRVDAPSVRASRARRCALIGVLAFGFSVSAAGNVRAADPPADAQTAPSMPDDLLPTPPALPTA